MGDIVTISYIGPGSESQTYNQSDDALITNNFIYTQFGDPNDYVEMFVYDLNRNLLDKVYDVSSYSPASSINPSTGLHNQINLDPQGDLASRGYDRGSLNVQYNFHRNLFNSSYGAFYWIKEISQTRKEIKLSSQNISNTDILNGYNQYQAYISGLNYYNDFYLNFGNNQTVIAVNVAYTEDQDGSYLLIKLYEPLPSDFDLKSQLWIVEKLAEPVTYNVDIQVEAVQLVQQNTLRGPNFNVAINQSQGQSTPYYTYNSLFSSPISSSFQKLLSYYQDKSVNINIDYSDFKNFVHFSSATDRVNNFANKVAKLESLGNQLAAQLAISGGFSSPAVSSSVVSIQNSINSITTNFDTYEYYLYYSSGSFTWPKSNSTQPYVLFSVTSSQAKNWLGSPNTAPSSNGVSMLFSASYYDNINKDLLSNTIPQYILDDSSNQPYIDFVNMIGQMFDSVWIYYKDVTNRFDATNNPATGISPDLVADALMGLGMTLYTNTNVSDNLYYSLFGINAGGSLLPPTGSQHITNYVTSSLTTLSADSIQKELYKRLYHNIPYLYKTKGTRACMQALSNIFGVPSSILTINEFGGVSRFQADGIFDEPVNYKVSGSTVTLSISSSLLNPYVSVQYFDPENRLNSKNLEFGFSPADEINNTITGSLGQFNLDQLIGNPNYQYSSSYPALDQKSRTFFSQYNYSHNMYEYVRLLQYYNNTLFKIAEDFVPARANLSKGIIVKSHMLERNKYERHEPSVDMSQNYSQSMCLESVTGSDAGEIKASTSYIGSVPFIVVPLSNASGSHYNYEPVTVNNSYSWEKYTGEFSGSEFKVRQSPILNQIEKSSITYPWTSSISTGVLMFSSYSISPLYQNITSALPSRIFSEVEYGYGQIVPSDFGLILSQSSCQTCNRVNCYTYNIQETGGSNITISYQDCKGQTQNQSILAYQSFVFCGKPNSLLVYGPYGNVGYLNYNISTDGSICGSTFSNESYLKCTTVSFSNLTSSAVTVSYAPCGNLFPQQISINAMSSTNPVCITDGTMFSGSVQLIPGNTYDGKIDVIGSGDCSPSPTGSLTQYCYNTYVRVSTGSYLFNYQNCNGTVQTLSGSFNPTSGTSYLCSNLTINNSNTSSVSMSYLDCLGTLHTASIAQTSSLGPTCVRDGSLTYISLSGSQVAKTIFPGEVYLKVSVTASSGLCSSTIGISTSNTINLGCSRPETVAGTGIIATTHPISYCGYYENPTQYTGSRNKSEVQDYNYYKASTVYSRYVGAKSISSKYNVYTPGDQSYGSSPAIDDYLNRIGLFTQVDSSSYFPDQMVLKLPYLADVSGGLSELNLQNYDWVYFQNVFKNGDVATIKQFNPTQYTNQKYLDKTYPIVESGYSYQPYWYRTGSAVECYSIDGYQPSGAYADITVANAQAQVSYSAGSFPNSANPTFYPTIPSGAYNPLSYYNTYNTSLWTLQLGPLYEVVTDDGNNLVSYSSGSQYNYVTGSYFVAPQDGIYDISANVNYFITTNVRTTGVNSVTLSILKVSSGASVTSSFGFLEGTVLSSNSASYGTLFFTPSGLNDSVSTEIKTAYLSKGDRVFVKMSSYLGLGGEINFFINSFDQNFQIEPIISAICIDTSTAYHKLFNSSSFVSGSDTIQLTQGMDMYFNSSTTYLPSYVDLSSSPTASISPLYSTFGDINYTTNIEVGDFIILYYSGNSVYSSGYGNIYPIKRKIINIVNDGVNPKTIQVYPALPGYLNSSNINNFYQAVFLKHIPDETTVILEGKKRPGNTSFGFLLPSNVSPNIIQNINSIQATVQSQILSAQGSTIGL